MPWVYVEDAATEAAYVELLLDLPRKVTKLLQQPCPDCEGPLTTDAFPQTCLGHPIHQAEAIRDAIFLLGAERP